MKHKFSLSVNRNILKKSKYQQYFHCFVVCILVSHAFWFSYQQNIMTILLNAAFRVAALIRGRRLFQCGYPKVRRSFEARRLLHQIFFISNSFISNCTRFYKMIRQLQYWQIFGNSTCKQLIPFLSMNKKIIACTNL